MLRMEVTGLDELERQLIALGEKAGTKVLREAGRAALQVVEQDMKEHAGYDESAKGPHMRDSIKIRSTNPNANPHEERVQLFYVNAKTSETRTQVDFELCSPFDIQSLQLPSRQITPVCTWCMRGWYRTGTGCDYAGNRYFAKDGTPTNDPSKDVCGGRLADCKARFGEDQPLPFGGFPAANLQGK